MEALASTTLAPAPPVASGPIARASLHDEVTNRVRDMIVDGSLRAGAAIAELELAGQLGVSRTPLREALKVLAAEGLVDLLPGRGAVVKVLTAKDAQDMLALIALLEEQAGREACNASDAEIASIVALHQRMRGHFARRERFDYFQLNQDIHNAIVRAANNPTLAMLHGILRTRMRRIRYIGNEAPANWTAAMAEHDALIAALEARDPDALARTLRLHLDNTWPRVAAMFDTVDAGI